MFETKIVILLRNDLAAWQGLNVTAFLMSGIVAETPAILGEAYRDRDGNVYNAMSIQPVVVLSGDQPMLSAAQRRCLERGIRASAYVEEMFSTGHDTANRAVFSQFSPDNARLAGIAFRAEKRIADKIAKGAKMHP
jgi:hypothetical protein